MIMEKGGKINIEPSKRQENLSLNIKYFIPASTTNPRATQARASRGRLIVRGGSVGG